MATLFLKEDNQIKVFARHGREEIKERGNESRK
jgi:hypothetical protein